MPFWRGVLTSSALGLSALLATGAYAHGGPDLVQINQAVPPVVARSVNLGHVSPNQVVHISLTLQPSDVAAMNAFADSVSDPKSPNYLKFITPAEFGVRFGQPASTFQAAVDYFKNLGFKVTLVGDNRLSINADCTVAQAEQAFNTTINQYRALDQNVPGRANFYSYSKAPSLPSAFAGVTTYIGGLENFTAPKPRTTLTPSMTRTLYNLSPLFSGGFTGAGRTIGISNWDGFRVSNVPIFYRTYGLPTPAGGPGSNVQVVTISGGSGSGSPSGEGDLDLQMPLGQAPLANLIVYDGTQLQEVLQREANDNKCDVISESYGWFLSANAAEAAHTLHVQMTTQGITYCVASGDNGTDELTNTTYWYATIDPDILCVGGTTATTDGSGKRRGEVSWSGSGGGYCTISTSFNRRPTWQKGTGVPSSPNYRLAPDIAGHASDNFQAYNFIYNGSVSAGDGTSFTSPVVAGEIAVLEQKLIAGGGLSGVKRLGRLNDKIYSQNGRSDVYFDIVSGPGNGPLPDGSQTSVTRGWDYVTGWGAIDWNAFASTFQFAPPVVLTPNAVSIYAGQGSNLVGLPSYLASAGDNAYVTVTSAKDSTGIGAVSGLLTGFSTTTDLSKMSGIIVTGAATSDSKTTIYVYAYNYATTSYTQLGTLVGNGAAQTFSYPILTGASSYTSGGAFRVLLRAVSPTRLGGTPFNLSVDQVNIQLNF